MTLDRLKVAARQHEQRDDWRAAIDLYRQALAVAEQGDAQADPALHNRIGDLEQKVGNDAAACEAWEHAAPARAHMRMTFPARTCGAYGAKYSGCTLPG